MKYYPVFLRVAGRPCLVIGGGPVGQQKTQSLLRAGAQVTVISPNLTPALSTFAAAARIQHHQRPYASGDLHGFFLAYAATGDERLHTQIARDAREAGVLFNVVDRPQLCDFIAPSVMERGDLLIATSTSGASPALAKRIRQDLEGMFGAEYDLALQLLGRLRERLVRRRLTLPQRQRIFTSLVDSPLLDYLRTHQTTEIDRLLAATVGTGVSLASLGMELS
jgi:precorrin-2 dehydrogenase/sirohydrochlorin ferrochelatase